MTLRRDSADNTVVPSTAVILFAATMFANALLLFLVQPMFAKLLLPLFGGSPAVWTTCMLFFQTALLAGYAYSHALVKLRKPWQQAMVHSAVVMLPLLTLPVTVSARPQVAGPIASVLLLSLVSVGPAFFALATSAPLLQSWFAVSRQRSPIDPYFLYAASNAGSLISLVIYPTVVEPALKLSTQTHLWSIGYGAAAVLTMSCAFAVRRSTGQVNREIQTTEASTLEPVTPSRRARWIALAFVPSSLMLAVTAYLSTDVAPVPLLWVIPLALYLVTFILTFSLIAGAARNLCTRAFPFVLLLLIWPLVSEVRLPLVAMAVVHLISFFVLAMLCHGALAADRPAHAHLTDFYLCLAIGGALGGVFNTIVAPLLFNRVVEYPLVVALAVLLLPRHPQLRQLLQSPGFWLRPALAGVFTILALRLPGTGPVLVGVVFVPMTAAVLVSFSVSRKATEFAAAIAIMVVVYLVVGGRAGHDAVYASRTFFGIYRVVSTPAQPFVSLHHGTTLHGLQSRGALTPEPLTYYHRQSPIGEVLTGPAATARSVGVVGLGIGTLAAYRQPDQRWTFYEIDPEVEKIARDDRFFTHLQGCGSSCDVVLGDARLSLAQHARTHDILVLDAFSSDAIPIHLLTREAVALYLSRLNQDGLLVFHISNNHLRLRPVIAALMREHSLTGRARLDQIDDSDGTGRNSSHWAVLARNAAALGGLTHDKRWEHLDPSGQAVWTDDFSNIWSVIGWRH